MIHKAGAAHEFVQWEEEHDGRKKCDRQKAGTDERAQPAVHPSEVVSGKRRRGDAKEARHCSDRETVEVIAEKWPALKKVRVVQQCRIMWKERRRKRGKLRIRFQRRQ